MNAQTLLNRHPRVMQTIYWMAADNNRNIYQVGAEYGHTQTEVRAFLDDVNRHGIDVPRPAGWHNFKNDVPVAPPSEQLRTPPSLPSLTDMRITNLEKELAELKSRLSAVEARNSVY